LTPDMFFVILENIWSNATVIGEYVQYTATGVEEDIDFGNGWHLVRVSEPERREYIVKYYRERASVVREDGDFNVCNSQLVQMFLDWAEEQGWW